MKKILIVLVVLLIFLGILGGLGYLGYNYYKDRSNVEIEETFYKNLVKNNFKELFDTSLYQNMQNKINENPYHAEVDMKFSNTFQDTTNFDLSKLTFGLDIVSDGINKKNNIKVKYSNNDFFDIDVLSNEKYIGIKNSDIVNQYVAINRKNSNKTFSKMDKNLVNFSDKFSKIKEENVIRENKNNIFSLKDKSQYIDTIKKYLKKSEIKDEGDAIINQNNEKISVHIYSMTIEKDEAIRFFDVMSDMLLKDEDFVNSLICENKEEKNQIEDFQSEISFENLVVEEEAGTIHSFGNSGVQNQTSSQRRNVQVSNDKVDTSVVFSKFSDTLKNVNENYLEKVSNNDKNIKYIEDVIFSISGLGRVQSKTEVKDELDKIIKEVHDVLAKKIPDGANVKILEYVSEGKTKQVIIKLGNNSEIQIDYISLDSNNPTTKITFVENENETYNGYSINFSKSKTNVIENNNIEIDTINNSEVIGKINLKLTTEGSEKSNKFDNTFNFTCSNNSGKFSFTVTNTLKFERIDVENLNKENCLLLDKLGDENFYYTINRINNRIDEVYNKKLSELNIIDSNASNKVIQKEENNDDSTVDSESEMEKEAVKNVLIENIANKMGEFEDEGKVYKIKNLKDLQIEGYELEVSVSDELAKVKINGYTFSIDKDFNLSE